MIRGPRWEADSLACDWPIVTGAPGKEGEMLFERKKEESRARGWGTNRRTIV